MLDHLNIPVSDIQRSFRFYKQVLTELGQVQVFEDKDAYGFGNQFWQFGIFPSDDLIVPLHVAFTAIDTNQVEKFYQCAIEQGAKSNGQPGLREQYGPDYYAAYVFDFDGHNIEVVCRR